MTWKYKLSKPFPTLSGFGQKVLPQEKKVRIPGIRSPGAEVSDEGWNRKWTLFLSVKE